LFFAYALFSLFTPVARTLAGGQGQRQRVISQSGKIVVAGGGGRWNWRNKSCWSGKLPIGTCN